MLRSNGSGRRLGHIFFEEFLFVFGRLEAPLDYHALYRRHADNVPSPAPRFLADVNLPFSLRACQGNQPSLADGFESSAHASSASHHRFYPQSHHNSCAKKTFGHP
jgi:hypothetical protein